MLSGMRGWEWLIILLLVVLLFGAKKLPETARGLGRSLRIFKAETKSLRDDDDEQPETTAQQSPAQQAPQQLPPAQAPGSAPPVQQNGQQPYGQQYGQPQYDQAPPAPDPAPYDR